MPGATLRGGGGMVPGRLDAARRRVRSVRVPNSPDLDTALRAIPVGWRNRTALGAGVASRQDRVHRLSDPRRPGHLPGRRSLARRSPARRRTRRRPAISRPWRDSINLEQEVTSPISGSSCVPARPMAASSRPISPTSTAPSRPGCANRHAMAPAGRHLWPRRRRQRHHQRASGIPQCRWLRHPGRRRHAAASGF